MVDLSAPKGGMVMADLASPPQDKTKNYTASKRGSWFLAGGHAREVGQYGILSLTQTPGSPSTNLWGGLSSLCDSVGKGPPIAAGGSA
jgi:NAD(P)-dependent dehydrogenase (short-subunit alcohol dehydrogenase family)